MDCKHGPRGRETNTKIAARMALVVQAAMCDMDDMAVAMFRHMGREVGVEAAMSALATLAVMAAGPANQELAAQDMEFAGIVILDSEGNEHDIETVPYPVRWTGRMMAAAINEDWELVKTLIITAIDDQELDGCIPELARVAGMAEAEWELEVGE